MGKKKVIVGGEGADINPLEINNALDNSELTSKINKKKLKKLKDEDVVNEMLSDISNVKNAPKVTILIHSGAGKLGGEPVFVAVNGQGYLIPRDKPFAVPEPILKALEDATETQYFREEKDGQFFGPIISRNVPRFAINKISERRN